MALYIGDTLISGEIEGQKLNNPFSLLDYKYSEYELSNASWLLSNGQWNSGAVYQSVYDLLLQIYNGTVTKAGVSVKLSTETYADTDFVLNTGDTTFRLPLKVLMAGSKRVAGNGMALGMTDGSTNMAIAAGVAYSSAYPNWSDPAGYGQNVGTAYSSAYTGKKIIGVTTDPTKSGIETSANGLYLYFYVGETVQDANIIAAGQALTDIANLKAHCIVETYVNGTSWYRVYSDGWCEQGGIINVNYAQQTVDVILLKQYANTDYSVLLTAGGYAANGAINDSWQNKTTSKFTIYGDYTQSTALNVPTTWQACGYIS